jgi:hypothetical protein
MPGPQLERLQLQSDQRQHEFTPTALPPPVNTAIALLEHVAADGWLERVERHRCPNCTYPLDNQQAVKEVCQDCGATFEEYGGITTETVYVRKLPQSRDVEWVIAIHGMNTTGTWQEAFSWYFGTTWGRSVPVAVYKYGIVIPGVVLAWRRRKLQRDLRDKLAAQRDEAQAQGFTGKPDVIAHSFGTWLLGHLLQSELARKPEEQLKFGRIILAGCVLRPDFDWKAIKDAGLVDDVLNHYATKDRVVPWAHATIWDSGSSGRRGFDGDQVVNIRAEGFGHSDLFSVDKRVVNGKCFQSCTGDPSDVTHLKHSYTRYWRPFLTLPKEELCGLPDRENPPASWRPWPWPLRGTLFPFVALPVILGLITLLIAALGKCLWELRASTAIVAGISLAGLLALMLLGPAVTWLWRKLTTQTKYGEASRQC